MDAQFICHRNRVPVRSFRVIVPQRVSQHRPVLGNLRRSDRNLTAIECPDFVLHVVVPEDYRSLRACRHQELVISDVKLHAVHRVKVIVGFSILLFFNLINI